MFEFRGKVGILINIKYVYVIIILILFELFKYFEMYVYYNFYFVDGNYRSRLFFLRVNLFFFYKKRRGR